MSYFSSPALKKVNKKTNKQVAGINGGIWVAVGWYVSLPFSFPFLIIIFFFNQIKPFNAPIIASRCLAMSEVNEWQIPPAPVIPTHCLSEYFACFVFVLISTYKPIHSASSKRRKTNCWILHQVGLFRFLLCFHQRTARRSSNARSWRWKSPCYFGIATPHGW